MRTPTLFLPLAATLRAPAHGQDPRDGRTPEAAAFLETALDTIQAVTMGRDTIPGRRSVPRIRLRAGRSPPGRYLRSDPMALRQAKHSFLHAAPPGAAAGGVDERVGYVRVPQRGGAAVALADAIHDGIRRLRNARVCVG